MNKKKTIPKKTIPLSKDMAPRIITGRFKNAALMFYKTKKNSGIRAVTHKARGMVFSWLCSRLMRHNHEESASQAFSQLNVVDCFAGFGSYGFESLSRGASHCLFIENSPVQQSLILSSAKKFSLTSRQVGVWTGTLPDSIEDIPLEKNIDILFIAPPYKEVHLGEEVLKNWPASSLKSKTFAIFEGVKTYDFPEVIEQWHFIEQRSCGLAKIGFYCTDPSEKKEKNNFFESDNSVDSDE